MEEQFALCRVAIAPMRAEPTDRAEIVSQLLFGDNVVVLQKSDRWWRVRSLHDQYEGWIDFKQVTLVSEPAEIFYLAPPHVHNELTAGDGSKYYLAAGSNLPAYKDGFCQVGEERFKLEFDPMYVDFQKPAATVTDLAHFYTNAPYLWGGRTLFGIDCSGFVQAVFKMAGIHLRRDASQQAEQGSTVDFLPHAVAGDIAFFDNEEGKITHVGILLGNDTIIHSSGKVRVDPIDDQGIFNPELQRYTHKLRIIKRFLA